ncbi:tRNA (guanosine(37)-N1)-methyltransferase TrmD [Algiphilus sp.]|uniref:tRNA (guanosine(37)-N1)-methyltransferase TrmD n=1 Tax=Algiphilus sp. TaxID=1872431 RepID=UPI001CA73C9C|nr:tRNA (guanosine(37)-N1)-methyltransferase TrmD [Algiphilus sp.]MBY8966506.1 tRNA (guanosine(37)-N1)-methyltransferase TrmD [Algiphilus acroporae]MCI5061457.1 tRNA (guanosine(37)-N1)-methyltransferase TrmD [Algiphilus sp.]MCI5104485.1 tRNA (guanosine(37)-N1)-methyltransferase TrmD [Algiphilus sp.]
MQVEVITLFPDMVEQGLSAGVPRIAREKRALQLSVRNPRDYADNPHRAVDDRPFGGGPGMVMQAPPVVASIEAARAALPQARVIAMSPQGTPLTQAWLQHLADVPELILLCGRYEGWDERIMPYIDVEISLGDFVLSGGELAAMALIDGVARLLPDVLGHKDSAKEDSFVEDLLDCPHYTRPASWRGVSVPELLLSGDHARIRQWRLQQALGATWLKRPDLLGRLTLCDEWEALLADFIEQQQSVRKVQA